MAGAHATVLTPTTYIHDDRTTNEGWTVVIGSNVTFVRAGAGARVHITPRPAGTNENS